MTKKKIIELIGNHLVMAKSTKDYYMEKYKKDYGNNYYYERYSAWRTICDMLEGILSRIK